jgi:hypothetical protein
LGGGEEEWREKAFFPEGRLGMGMVAGITFLINLFWFVLTGYKSIRWIVSIPASTLRGWSFYTLILMTYTYTEDSYKMSFPSSLTTIL